MPELPEVETVARQLEPHLVGRTVRRFRMLDPLLEKEPTPKLTARRIDRVYRLGKQVLLAFDEATPRPRPLYLAVHLRMTGRLQWSDEAGAVEAKHLRARFDLDRGRLLFYDTRRFGTFRWHSDEATARPAGLDPLEPGMSARKLSALLQRGGDQNIKVWLLRQDRLVGLGNIYASEILHDAGLSPLRGTRSLTAEEIGRLHRSTRKILRRAIRHCGTTFSDFQDAYGVTGSYQQYLHVYEREDEPCRRCRGEILRVVQAQRSTYYCPDCQD